jgi:hypothetical protein
MKRFGPVAHAAYSEVGSSCISERGAIEVIADGKGHYAIHGFR